MMSDRADTSVMMSDMPDSHCDDVGYITLSYRDEIVWTLKTSCKEEERSGTSKNNMRVATGGGLSGVVSTCTITNDDCVLIRVSTKQVCHNHNQSPRKSATGINNNNNNNSKNKIASHSIEYRKVRLMDILRRSSVEYESEMSSSSSGYDHY